MTMPHATCHAIAACKNFTILLHGGRKPSLEPNAYYIFNVAYIVSVKLYAKMNNNDTTNK